MKILGPDFVTLGHSGRDDEKAVVVESPGGIDALKYGEIEVPSLSSGQVLVKNEYAGLNFIDTCERLVVIDSRSIDCLTAVAKSLVFQITEADSTRETIPSSWDRREEGLYRK